MACDGARRTRQTVFDPDRQAGRQGHEKGLTFIRVEDWKSPYEIDPYDTYIIFEEHLGAMLFARKYLKI